MNFLNDPYIWLVFSFAIFCGILWKKGKGAFLALLDKRIELIREEIKTAENLRTEAQELLAQYQRKHRDALKDAEKIISNAEKQAAAIQQKAESELNESIERRERQLKERLERMEQSAINQIQAYAADLAIKATAEIIAHKLDKKANEKLVDQAIKDIDKNLH